MPPARAGGIVRFAKQHAHAPHAATIVSHMLTLHAEHRRLAMLSSDPGLLAATNMHLAEQRLDQLAHGYAAAIAAAMLT